MSAGPTKDGVTLPGNGDIPLEVWHPIGLTTCANRQLREVRHLRTLQKNNMDAKDAVSNAKPIQPVQQVDARAGYSRGISGVGRGSFTPESSGSDLLSSSDDREL